MDIIFLDTETTGVNFLTDEIIQASAIRVDVVSGSVLSSMNVFMEATNERLDPLSLKVTGYYKGKWKKEKKENLVSKKDGAQIIYNFLMNGDCIFSHNSAFDNSFVTTHILKHSDIGRRFFPKYWFDTHTIAFLFKYHLADFKSTSLDYCIKKFKLDSKRSSNHDALEDCYLLKDVFFKMMKQISIHS